MYCYLFRGEASVMLAGVRSFLTPTGGRFYKFSKQST